MPTEPTPGGDRVITLWGGWGARQALRMQFPWLVVDNRIHDMAHTDEGVELVRGMGFNRVLLMCAWGFPPEQEEINWETFRRAVRLYHKASIQVVGGVRVGSCVAQGSYRDKAWYARDPWGKRIPVHAGRFWVCWNDDEWLAEVRSRIQIVIEAEADGLLLAEPWAGGLPFEVGRGLLGAAGCHDVRCQAAYTEANEGQPIPRWLNLRRPHVQRYLAWRAALTTRRLAEWAEYARELKPQIEVVVEDQWSATGSAAARWGLDRSVERMYGPRLLYGDWPGQRADRQLAQNAARLGSVLSSSTRPAVWSHPVGQEEVNRVRTGQTCARALAEASAMQTVAAFNGGGMVRQNSLTLILHPDYEAQRQAVGKVNQWLAEHAEWLNVRSEAGPLAVYCPADSLNGDWGWIGPLFGAACQVIIQHGLPFRVVGEGEWNGVKTLIVPPGRSEELMARLVDFTRQGGRVIALQEGWKTSAERPIWTSYRPGRGSWLNWLPVRPFSARAKVLIWRMSQSRGLVSGVLRRWRRGAGVDRSIRNQADLPPVRVQDELLAAIGRTFAPRAEAAGPLLFTIGKGADGGQQWHLVNYLDEPQRVTLHAPEFVGGWVYAPGEAEGVKIFGTSLMVTVETYKVVRLAPAGAGRVNAGS